MDELLVAILIMLTLLGSVAVTVWHFRRARSLLDHWAHDEHFELESADYCWMWRGPFWWRAGSGNAVYRVVARYPDGIRRSGYVRCGSLFGGLFSDEVTAIWDD